MSAHAATCTAECHAQAVRAMQPSVPVFKPLVKLAHPNLGAWSLLPSTHQTLTCLLVLGHKQNTQHPGHPLEETEMLTCKSKVTLLQHEALSTSWTCQDMHNQTRLWLVHDCKSGSQDRVIWSLGEAGMPCIHLANLKLASESAFGGNLQGAPQDASE